MNIRQLSFSDNNFMQQLDELLHWDVADDKEIEDVTAEIIAAVRSEGDRALLAYTEKFDGWQCNEQNVQFDHLQLKQAWLALPEEQSKALTIAADRIKAYAEKQKITSWQFSDELGNQLGQKVSPLQRVGIYVPGGKAAYPSSVLMNAIPAKVAGVEEIIMVTPTPKGSVNRLVLAAAYLAGVDKVFSIGGAQAVAALAYGTKLIPRVDKIVGPGNIYVATAKKMVFGQVGIDMIAGPSEILVICDGKTNPDWIAMDLFSQAEHDQNAQSILLSTDKKFFAKVLQSIDKLLPEMERADIIAESLRKRGGFIYVESIAEAISVSNRIAPEHLELSIDEPERWLKDIQHAGAIFMGRHTPEALGDYCAGPNHVLPTSGTARFSSPLGVYDFQKRSSLINCSPQGAAVLAETASVLARGEALTAHARSAEYRADKK